MTTNMHGGVQGSGTPIDQEKFPGACNTEGTPIDTSGTDFPMTAVQCQADSGTTALLAGTTEPRIDSRLLAQHLQNKHQSLFELIKDHRADFEQLGLLRFQTGKVTGGRPEKFTMLNEDQCTLALSYSKNTPRVRQLKIMLVKAFGEARRAAAMRRTEYLPSYHYLHDVIHLKAAGSAKEHHVHVNINKLLNKTVGLEAGQRRSAPIPQQALLTVAQAVAAQAMRGAHDHHDGYQRVKQSMLALTALTMLDAAPLGQTYGERS